MKRVLFLLAGLFVSITVVSADSPAPRIDAEKLFKRLDANGDVKLSKDEFKKLAELGQSKLKDRPEVIDKLFERLDANKDGVLLPEEFKKLSELREQGKQGLDKKGRPELDKKEPSPGKSNPQREYQPGGQLAAVVEDQTWTDKARGRDVPVRISAPDVKHGKGPYPTILFSHGGGESREAFGYLIEYWARLGYITICMTHAGTDREAVTKALAGGGAREPEFELRPQDVRFVLERMLSGKSGSALLDGRVDAERIGMAGQCMGCTTALAMVGLNLKKDDKPAKPSVDGRIKAVLALGPQVAADSVGGRIGLHPDSWTTVRPPVMVVTGDKDFLWVQSVRNDPKTRRRPYDAIPGGAKYHVEILGAEHNAFTNTKPWYPAGERDPRHHGWIRQIGTAYFDAYLKKDKKALDWLQSKGLEEATGGQCQQEHVLADAERPTAPTGQTLDLYKPKPAIPQLPNKPPYEVRAVELIKLTDKARGKELQVKALYPVTKSLASFPVILFSHYSGGTKDDYDRLLRDWAGNGYVCLLPNHADSPQVGGNRGAKSLQGWRDRALDLLFLLDSLEALEQVTPALQGKLNKERVAVGGHYIGAHSAGLLAGMKVFGQDGKGETFADKRVRAVLMLSPTGRGQGLTEKSWTDMKVPMLVMTGSNDPSKRTGHTPEWRTEPYQFAAPGDKYLVFLEGLEGTYDGLFSKEPKLGELVPYVKATTLAFWDAHLRNVPAARDFLGSDKVVGKLKLSRK